jgi:hypothetical protein
VLSSARYRTFCLIHAQACATFRKLDKAHKHTDKQESPLNRRDRQAQMRIGHRAVWTSVSSYQAASWDKPTVWFVTGLQRFVNAEDSLSAYQALGKAFPSFWPLPIEDGERKALSWHPDAHGIFLFYRNLLRRFWTRDPDALKYGFNTDLLFGTVSYDEMQKIIAGKVSADWALEKALAPLRNLHPGLHVPEGSVPFASFWLDWSAGTVAYISQIDFQRAIWLLFRESWRAKVCPKCSTYFLVQKPAQLYCSPACSQAAHRTSSLTWWKKKGFRRRATRAKANDKGRKRQ